MKTLVQNNTGKLMYKSNYGQESIHLIHCGQTIKEIKEDTATPYIVAEEATNFARLHLVTDFSEDEALQQVDEYLKEKEGHNETHLITVIKLKI